MEDGIPFNNNAPMGLRRYCRDLILMQSTGLTDKNGKEIFEGDILRDSLGNTFEVFWDSEDCAAMHMRMKRGTVFDMGEAPKYEVIGNIYSNPGLLPSS